MARLPLEYQGKTVAQWYTDDPFCLITPDERVYSLDLEMFIVPSYHQGRVVYRINGRRHSQSKLRNQAKGCNVLFSEKRNCTKC